MADPESCPPRLPGLPRLREARRFVLGVVATLALVTSGIGAPAWADDEVGLSLDGATWSSELNAQLFDPGFRWVPGDVETAAFWVRNRGPSGATLTIALQADDPDRLLAPQDFAIDARAGQGRWVSLANGVPSEELTAQSIAQGDQARVELRVAFSTASQNQSQLRRLPLRFRVRLSEGRPSGDSPRADELPAAGAAASVWLVWVAAGMIGSGLALVLRSRTRTQRRAERQHG